MTNQNYQPPELLLITWNRRAYLERTIANLLADPADFRLYCWDNGSSDGTQDVISGLNDSRVAVKHLHAENVGQFSPCMWFLDQASSDVVGKVDDDVLLPAGWTERISPLVRANEQVGMLGCWIFAREDWDPQAAALNTIMLNGVPVLRMTSIAGHSFLARREILNRYRRARPQGHGIPIDRRQMLLDGLISGVPLPPMFAENMDDPRSAYFQFKVGNDSSSALTARSLGFSDSNTYADWIADDAERRLNVPIARQIRILQAHQRQGLMGRIERRVLKLVGFG